MEAKLSPGPFWELIYRLTNKMQVIKTFVVADESGIFTLFQTYELEYFITTHIVGRLKKITEDEAKEMIRKTPQFIQ